MIVILDYGVGNLTSIKNMLRKAGANSVITNDKGAVADASKLILPGIGAFEYGMGKLRSMPYFDVLNQRVLEEKTPVLGVCLGAQLLFKQSEEGAFTEGLGWIDGRVERFKVEEMNTPLKVPHMGWSDIHLNKSSRLFEGMYNEPRFYFVHTYHMVCNDPNDALVNCEYGYPFVAGVEKENILGVQFHPEKSHKFGLKLYSNFINNY